MQVEPGPGLVESIKKRGQMADHAVLIITVEYCNKSNDNKSKTVFLTINSAFYA